MSGRLDSLAAVVTGGGSGIGRGVVEAYLAEGVHVTVLERSQENADRLSDEHADDIQVVVGDATDPDRLAEAVDAARSAGRAHAQLTCCVGVHDSFASLRELAADDLARAAGEIWSTNVLSTLLAANAAHSWLQEGQGSMTLTLSESAFHVTGGGVLYGSSKWALRGVVAHLSHDLAPSVRVNGVAPGGTSGTKFAGPASLGEARPADTRDGRDQMIADGNVLGMAPSPADHAGAYVYLADPQAARVITGMVIKSDGGRR
jgi:NAD(P)-dependent dehydrogenase (short-subunit alcohol dehydrogenase family)